MKSKLTTFVLTGVLALTASAPNLMAGSKPPASRLPNAVMKVKAKAVATRRGSAKVSPRAAVPAHTILGAKRNAS